ncbi:rRNA maturation RNase YbeY [Sporosarcina sp. FA9]|uniref:rRNA maturation RNase YbeY n=1 Tax=Sporosarcina sp. FA9 TaxID=3413030 RepID=UPI003F65C077
MLNLYFNDETETIDKGNEKKISDLLIYAAEAEGLSGEAEISITFMTDAEIQEINEQYRGINKPTDVISFALEELTEDEIVIVVEEGMPKVLGDILISVETARRQAHDYGHDFDREIGFLALHGLLHLLGYDHQTPEEETEMFGRQKEILESFGLRR